MGRSKFSEFTAGARRSAASRVEGAIRPIAPRWSLIALMAASALLTGCVIDGKTLDAGPKLTSSWVKPDDPQERLGKREHPLVLSKYGGAYSDPQAEAILAIIVGKLVAVSNDPARIYKITILNSPKVNAFALPGGYLYVTRGLLALANDSSELAAVIAHEMAHVASNHAILRQKKLSKTAIGRDVVDNVLEGNRAGKIALAANKVRLARFSQEQELQADAVGIRMIGNAGYDPFAAARFLETMNRYRDLRNRERNRFPDGNFLSSHPTTPARIDLARKHARFFGAPGIGEKGRERYLEGIDGILYGDSAKEGFVRGQKFIHGGLGISFEAPEGFSVQNQPKAVILAGPAQLATRFDATVLAPQRELGPYLKSGWVSGLLEETVTEQDFNGLQGATGVAVSDGWRFRVVIVRNNEQLYRFITAGPQINPSIDAVSNQVLASLKVLDAAEVAQLRPLRVRIITAQNGDNLGSLSAKMKGTQSQLSLFKTLNALGVGSSIEPNQRYKIITE